MALASIETLSPPFETPEGRVLRLVARLDSVLTARSVVPISIALTVLLGFLDYETEVEIPFTMLYLLPIGLGAWFQSRRFGVAVSGIATVCVVVSLVQDYAPLAVVWNTIGSFIIFMLVTWLVDHLRTYVERERSERRLAVDQLRHGERLQIIGTLAAGVAHELGTPLNVIAGCAELLGERDDQAQSERRITMILDQTAKISTIIRQLLDFGRRGRVERSRVDVNVLVQSVAAMLEATARKLGRTIVLELGPRPLVTGSSAELEQVVSNLILNGLQAMAHPGRVRVRTLVEERQARGVACIAIEDEGSGIPPEDVARIFDPFFTTKGVGEGTGLGLSVSYGIVRDHGGSIEVDSQPGRGSRFTIVLPLRDAVA